MGNRDSHGVEVSLRRHGGNDEQVGLLHIDADHIEFVSRLLAKRHRRHFVCARLDQLSEFNKVGLLVSSVNIYIYYIYGVSQENSQPVSTKGITF